MHFNQTRQQQDMQTEMHFSHSSRGVQIWTTLDTFGQPHELVMLALLQHAAQAWNAQQHVCTSCTRCHRDIDNHVTLHLVMACKRAQASTTVTEEQTPCNPSSSSYERTSSLPWNQS
jgi:hypothetical protein